jgi:hypothetical protein
MHSSAPNAYSDYSITMRRPIAAGTSGSMSCFTRPVSRHTPTEVQGRARNQNVRPLGHQRNAVCRERRKHHGREWRDRNCEKEQNVNPRETSLRAGQIVELVCWPTRKMPSVMKLIIYMTSRGESAIRARQSGVRCVWFQRQAPADPAQGASWLARICHRSVPRAVPRSGRRCGRREC